MSVRLLTLWVESQLDSDVHVAKLHVLLHILHHLQHIHGTPGDNHQERMSPTGS